MGIFNWLKKKKKETPVEQVKLEEKVVEPVVVSEEKSESKKEEKRLSETPKKFTYHVSHHKDGWKVKKSGGQKAIKVFKTQAEAINHAKHLAETHDTTFVIHKKDGSIRKQKY